MCGCIGIGRQILNRHKRCIREEDWELNDRFIDKVVIIQK
jgi:hypothetical protein